MFIATREHNKWKMKKKNNKEVVKKLKCYKNALDGQKQTKTILNYKRLHKRYSRGKDKNNLILLLWSGTTKVVERPIIKY